MLCRLLHWLRNRPRRLRGRLAARAIARAFPEVLTFAPGMELKRLLDWLGP